MAKSTRILTFSSLAAAGLLLLGAASSPVRAAEGPWCAILYDDGGENCSLPSFAQCLEHIRGPGGRCYENVMYRRASQRAATPKQVRRRDQK